MKLPCKVIEDILPLYRDNVCSDESRALVDEHLRECAGCRSLLGRMDIEPGAPSGGDDLKALEGIRSEWIKIKKRSLLKGVLLSLLAVLIVYGAHWGLTRWRFLAVPTEDIELSEVSVLSDGVIAFRLAPADGKPLHVLDIRVDEEAGVAYLTPRRAVFETEHPRDFLVRSHPFYYLALSPFSREQFRDPAYESQIVAAAEERGAMTADYMVYAGTDRVCVGTEGDNIVLWERGMELPPASDRVEELYQSGRR